MDTQIITTGIRGGAFNGINIARGTDLTRKVTSSGNISDRVTNLTPGNSSYIWTKNVWKAYRFVVRGNELSVYRKSPEEPDSAFQEIMHTTNDEIPSGSFGFVTLSQAYSFFRTIRVSATSHNSFKEIVDSSTWDTTLNKNFIINFSNTTDDLDTDAKNSLQSSTIYYIGVSDTSNQDSINNFVSGLGGKGTYIPYSDDTNSIINSIYNYVHNFLPE